MRDILFWQGMFAPAATPKAVLEKLNAALRLALTEPKVIRNFEQTDFSVFTEQEQTIAAANSSFRLTLFYRSNRACGPPTAKAALADENCAQMALERRAR